jgi:Flp pilus assembly secretin CpaC
MAAGLLGLLGATLAQPTAAQDIGVVLDQARLVKIPERISTVVIGNPLIADVSVQSGGLMVITGKGYGTTNIVALDRTGAVLMERTVSVLPPRQNVVVVYRGVDRETYSCTPTCDRRITLGDAPAFFDATLAQTANRNAQALGGAQAAK